MKPVILILAVIGCPVFAFCQDITGLWKGTMFNDSTKQSLEYEVVIKKENGKYAGFSHTSYIIDGARYYGVKKINVRIAKDGKIVMQDAKWIEKDYTGEQLKNVIQLNVLDFASSGEQSFLDGPFVTNRTTGHNTLTGRLSLKKQDPLTAKSELRKYMEINDENLTVAK